MNELLSFENLKLVEKPDCSRNAKNLPQTLVGCEGFLQQWPLNAANVNPKKPSTISDMVNILTDPEATAMFKEGEEQLLEESGDVSQSRVEGAVGDVYSYTSSGVMKTLLKAAKRRTCHVRAPGITGHVVNPGFISFYKKDGKTYAVTEGRWLLMSYKARWIAKNIKLDAAEIQPPNSQVLIIRVPPGSVGRILDQGVEVLLDIGTHVFNSGTIVNAGTLKYADHVHIKHGRYNYVRVQRGMLGKVWAEVAARSGIRSVQPRFLQEGEHYVDSHLFIFKGLSSLSDEYIEHGSLHRISVQKGHIAKVMHDNTPRILGEGDHIIESTEFAFNGTKSLITNPCIVHGTMTILRVTLGQIALAWQDSKPVFIDKPGLFEFDSPDFKFVSFKNAEDQLIQLGAKKIILCHTGQVAVTYDQGELKILSNGRHTIDSFTHVFHRFLSTQQRSIRLATLSSSAKIARKSMSKESVAAPAFDDDLTICETKDLVKVGLRADVFYSIEDPEKCILKIDTDELEDLVRETAVATLTNIVRSTALNDIAQSKRVSAKIERGVDILQPPAGPDGPPPPSAPTAVFFEKFHDEFLSKLHEDFLERYGVDIANIRIESFKIMDEELSEQISRHALTTAQIENEMANLEGTSLISTTRERTAAEVMEINAEAEAAAKKTEADARNQRQIDAARAEAESHKIAVRAKAEAEAEAILMKAKAEAEAICLKADAEAQRAEMLSRTTLGQQEALLAQYSHMVVESNQGVQKVIYLDPSVNRDSPFSLGSLNNLNMDLHALTQLGVATEQNGK